MPESSIADEITRLSACRNDILSAISAKGVSVPVGSVLSSCPSLIASIPTGGGGGGTALVNTGISAMYSAVLTAPVTATQIPGGGWMTLPYTAGGDLWASGFWGDISGLKAISITGKSNTYGTFVRDVYLATGYQSWWPTGSIGFSWSGDASTLVTGTAIGPWDTSTMGTLYPYTPVYLMIRNVVNDGATQRVAIDIGGGALPYPDRPATSYVTATASATSYKWATNGNDYLNVKYVDGRGYESSYTSYSVHSSELGSVTERSNSLQATLTGYYPETAYNFTMGTIGTSNASGSGWK